MALYPDIKVKLVGEDGNAYAIISKVKQALVRNKVPRDQITRFTDEAMSGDYNNVLQTAMKWVEVH